MRSIWFATCLILTVLASTIQATTSGSLNEQQSPRVEEGYVTAEDGVRLFYQKAGRGSKVIVVPGRLFTFDDFKQLADGFTLIAYDMRGRGRSDNVTDGERLTIHYDIKDLEAVRQHFRLSKFNVVGYSYLGLMVVMYAMDHPTAIERIVQLGPVPLKYGTEYPAQLTNKDKWSEIGVDDAKVAELEKLRTSGYDKSNPKEYCEKVWQVMRFWLVGDPARAARLGPGACDMPNEWPVNLERHFQYGFASVKRLDIPKEEVRRVRHPVLTIHGTKDRNAPYGAGREWALLLPNARLLTIEGAAHQAFTEFPEIVLPAIRSFMNGNWPKGSERVTTLAPPAHSPTPERSRSNQERPTRLATQPKARNMTGGKRQRPITPGSTSQHFIAVKGGIRFSSLMEAHLLFLKLER
jgi:pimeloyl-ACP methyl ester carboxylesterase